MVALAKHLYKQVLASNVVIKVFVPARYSYNLSLKHYSNHLMNLMHH